jgi:hypothetical protein
MHGGRENEPFITFPYLYAPPPSSTLSPLVLSCPALPIIIRLKTLLISSSSLFDLHPHQLCSDLNHEEQQGGAMKGRSIGTTPITPTHDVVIILHALHSECRWFILLWQILGIFGNVLEWKNVFSVHLNFVSSEEFIFCYSRDSFF